jgi:hypothetical protein
MPRFDDPVNTNTSHAYVQVTQPRQRWPSLNPRDRGDPHHAIRFVFRCCHISLNTGNNHSAFLHSSAMRLVAETPVLDWRERLVCSCSDSRQADFVVSGTKRPRKFLGVAARRRVVNHRRLIRPRYRDRSRRLLVGPRCRRVRWRPRRGA